jgi:hypothetical protein
VAGTAAFSLMRPVAATPFQFVGWLPATMMGNAAKLESRIPSPSSCKLQLMNPSCNGVASFGEPNPSKARAGGICGKIMYINEFIHIFQFSDPVRALR